MDIPQSVGSPPSTDVAMNQVIATVRRLPSNTRWDVATFVGAAVLLAPWILFLWFSQPSHGTEQNVGPPRGTSVDHSGVSDGGLGTPLFPIVTERYRCCGLGRVVRLGNTVVSDHGSGHARTHCGGFPSFRHIATPVRTAVVAQVYCWLRRRQNARRTQISLSFAYVASGWTAIIAHGQTALAGHSDGPRSSCRAAVQLISTTAPSSNNSVTPTAVQAG